MSNSSSDQPPPPLTYFDLFRQNGGHTAAMWLILGEKCALSLVGILFNAILVVATVKAKNLRSICNLLIAIDSAFLALFQLSALIAFLIALFGINFVPVSTCFYLQALPIFSVMMSFCVMFQIGLERLANVLFPIWSMKKNSKRFHVGLLLFFILTNLFLIWLCYSAYYDVNTMVMCTPSDITAKGLFYTIAFNRSVIMHILLIIIYIAIFLILKFKKGNQNFSKSIFRSLLYLVVFEVFGWLPPIYLINIFQKLQLSPVTGTYISAAFTTISSCITASANAPTLYYFSHLYRDAINAILVDVGIKNGGNRQTNASNSVVVVPRDDNLHDIVKSSLFTISMTPPNNCLIQRYPLINQQSVCLTPIVIQHWAIGDRCFFFATATRETRVTKCVETPAAPSTRYFHGDPGGFQSQQRREKRKEKKEEAGTGSDRIGNLGDAAVPKKKRTRAFAHPSLIRVIRQNRAFVMSALIWGLILDVRRQLPLLFAFLPEGIRSFEWAHMASKCLLLLTILIGIIDLLIF
uniref:G-protein coupled receptors family 1 profile domain-containing protein n=1 Tax=Globodera rostochiensis TaxID=31243 RepID=A0A914IGG1_GLORO